MDYTKTICLVVSKQATTLSCNVTINLTVNVTVNVTVNAEETINQADSYNHPGNIVTQERICDHEIKKKRNGKASIPTM